MFNNTYEGKKEFVTAVSNLLKEEQGSGVKEVNYYFDVQKGRGDLDIVTETVVIKFKSGVSEYINVSGNSNSAILTEIVAQIYVLRQ